MDAVLQALAGLVNDWGWLIVIIGLPSLGDAIGRWSAGRRTIAKVRAENKALRASNKVLGGSETTVITDPRLEALLWRVQATDDAVAQLPMDLRKDIDAVLAASMERAVTIQPAITARASDTKGKAKK